VKAVVAACNTATAHALQLLQSTFRVPVIGVLEPGVEATLADPACQRVGIIGTEGTIRSSAYQYSLAMRRPDLRIHAAATPLLVPFIEEGWTEHPRPKAVRSKPCSGTTSNRCWTKAWTRSCSPAPIIRCSSLC